MAAQQLAHPASTEDHPRALMEVGGKPCSRPAGEGKAKVPRLVLYGLQHQFEVLGRHARRTPRTSGIGQPFDSEQAPTTSAPVDAPRTHSQGLGDAAGALALCTPQEDGGTQSHALIALAQSPLQAVALGGAQLDALGLRVHHRSSLKKRDATP